MDIRGSKITFDGSEFFLKKLQCEIQRHTNHRDTSPCSNSRIQLLECNQNATKYAVVYSLSLLNTFTDQTTIY